MPDVLWENVAACLEIDGSVKLVYVEAAGSVRIWQAPAEWVSTLFGHTIDGRSRNKIGASQSGGYACPYRDDGLSPSVRGSWAG